MWINLRQLAFWTFNLLIKEMYLPNTMFLSREIAFPVRLYHWFKISILTIINFSFPYKFCGGSVGERSSRMWKVGVPILDATYLDHCQSYDNKYKYHGSFGREKNRGFISPYVVSTGLDLKPIVRSGDVNFSVGTLKNPINKQTNLSI